MLPLTPLAPKFPLPFALLPATYFSYPVVVGGWPMKSRASFLKFSITKNQTFCPWSPLALHPLLPTVSAHKPSPEAHPLGRARMMATGRV